MATIQTSNRCPETTAGSPETIKRGFPHPIRCQREFQHQAPHLAWLRDQVRMGAEVGTVESLVEWLRPADATISGFNLITKKRLDLRFENNP
jgi:hypothetical protein